MEEKITYFGQTNFRNKKVKFGIKVDDRRRHVYVIGKTGMGKSQLLENMIVSDIRHGFGVAVVDPHGDLVEGVLKYIPRNRLEDVVYFNPADTQFPIAFNVLEKVEPHLRPLVADGVVGVFKKIWADSWGPRLEYILRNAILALLEDSGSTLLGVVRILTDRKYRESVVKEVTDPVIRYFWTKEFPKYPDKDIATIIGPIQNKVGQYLANAMIRNIVGQPKSTINVREIMDNRKILLLNLSKGRIGEDTSNLLGALMITKIQLAAMSRVDIPENDRQDFYLYVDELQNFATDSFGGILSEARKYHLNMTMAHQYVEQLPESLQAAIFGNVGTIIAFRVGAVDAEHLAKEFAPTFIEEDFVNLPKFNIYLKLMIDGVASQPFSAGTLPPIGRLEGYEEKIIDYSREKYSKPLSIVEQAIIEWWDLEDRNKDDAEKKEGPTETVKKQIEKIKTEKGPVLEKKKEAFQAGEAAPAFDYDAVDWHNIVLKNKEISFDGIYNCDVCGAEMHLEFEPRLDKPILCYKCVKKRDKFFKRQKREKEEARQQALDKKDKGESRQQTAKEDKNVETRFIASEDGKKHDVKETEKKGSIKIVKSEENEDDFAEMMDIGKKKYKIQNTKNKIKENSKKEDEGLNRQQVAKEDKNVETHKEKDKGQKMQEQEKEGGNVETRFIASEESKKHDSKKNDFEEKEENIVQEELVEENQANQVSSQANQEIVKSKDGPSEFTKKKNQAKNKVNQEKNQANQEESIPVAPGEEVIFED